MHALTSQMFDRGRTPHAGEVLLGILGGSVPPCSPNPDPISDQKLQFSHLFSDLASMNLYRFSDLAKAEIMLSLLRLERKRKVFVKSISSSHVSLSFLLKSHKNHSLWCSTYLYDLCKGVAPLLPLPSPPPETPRH